MDAFILAAGLGTRLRPLTDTVPKALVPVAGVPMLERVARRLIDAGADRLIVNVHHHPAQIVDYLERHDGFGVPWAISPELERPLDTGGALRHARDLIRRDAPFFLHNVDVLAGFPLADMYAAHRASDALATVAVSTRPSNRGLLFGPRGLYGRVDGARTYRVAEGAPALARAEAGASGDAQAGRPADARAGETTDSAPAAEYGDMAPAERAGVTPAEHGDVAPAGAERTQPAAGAGPQGRFAFGGVHVIGPRILDEITETGAFSVLDLYLRLAAGGERIEAYRIDGYPWFDIGSAEKLAVAERALAG